MERPNSRFNALALTMLAVCAAALALAPAASAAFGVNNVTSTPTTVNAGANSDLSLSFDVVEPERDLKKLVVHLPPGLVGNPLATPTCTETQLAADGCPAASDVGDVSNSLVIEVLPALGVPFSVAGDVYNVAPRAGEPARFGFVLRPIGALPIIGGLLPPIVLQSPASLRPGDLGLDTTLDDIPNTASGLPINITGIDLTLEGQVGTPPQGFLRFPTSCGNNTISFDATAYDSSTASGSTAFTTENCGALPFSPQFSARIKQTGTLQNGVEVSTTIAQTIQEAGLKQATVTLPADLIPNGAGTANQCPASDFTAGTCPAATKVGDARATSPLQATPLVGGVYAVASSAGFPELGLDLRGALSLQLKGTISFTPDLRTVVTFAGLPDIPISDFTLTFAGGPNGLSTARRNLCEPPPTIFDTTFLSHSAVTTNVAATASVDCTGFNPDDSNGGGKDKPPTASVKLGKATSDEPTLKLKAKAGSDPIASAKLKLPKGLSFAKGRGFRDGASAKADGKKIKIKGKGSTLSLKTKGLKKLKAKVGGGALLAKGKLPKASKLRFKLLLIDDGGNSFNLKLRPR